MGDNLGYWLGRRFGADALRRYRSRLWLSPATLERSERFLRTHGAAAIFIARFIPGVRFAAGPISGISGVPAVRFLIANVLGAMCYVPVVVGIGYAIGSGTGRRLELARSAGVAIEHIVLAAALIGAIGALLLRARRPSA